ncbi:MAG TPA: polymer-forming cytoskeletal protein [Candidatus Binataceae bacterium]|nr:polymer-forming cytoskeletal protein [Candidatus Binataceae bacterium]
MALFNSKEPEKNVKPQAVTPPPVQSAPVPLPQNAVVDAKPVNNNNNISVAKPAPLPAAGAGAYLDAGSRISGKLSFETPARIDGQVDGEVNAKDSLTIGESAVVAAQIKADSVIVAGKVSGDIVAVRRIEIRPSAKVLGNITAPTLVINEGAIFEGHCAMQAEAHDDRKVTVFPKEKEERLAKPA